MHFFHRSVRGAILFFRSAPKNTNLVEYVDILLEEKSKMSQPKEARAAILFFKSARKTQTW